MLQLHPLCFLLHLKVTTSWFRYHPFFIHSHMTHAAWIEMPLPNSGSW